MLDRADFLRNSVIVAAHPDDELLWFNAILRDVDRVFIVFRDFWAKPALGAAREAAIAAFPRPAVECLNFEESGVYGCANWKKPVETEFGLDISYGEPVRELRRLLKATLRGVGIGQALRVAETRIASIYEANTERLVATLRPRLSADMNVFTHNPWGEYGHEEHVQVCRALQKLRREIGFRLWISNYCTDRALPLAQRYFRVSPAGYLRLPTDKAFAEKVADVYRRHDCWTWSNDWVWFDGECYMEMPEMGSEPAPHRHLVPLNMFTIDGDVEKSRLPLAIGGAAASAASAAALVGALDF